MIDDWDKAINFVLSMEGEYTFDPVDPGGETKFGISKKSYPSLDIKNLTVDQAKDIYKTDYWQVCHCDELPSPFAISVFDMAVNQGTGKAKRLLQIILGVDVDGIIGQKTIAAAFKADVTKLKRFLAMRIAEYIKTILENPSLNVFSVNWSYRVISLSQILLS